MRIGSLVFGKMDMILTSPEESPRILFRRRAEERALVNADTQVTVE
jgi:hypothetical protein